ncbi:MAG: recombinase family protein [Steroidobacteraceae bacterium]|nr:recombinase family protein [Steroidobacteraceae bacterium]
MRPVPPELLNHLRALRAEGHAYQHIADRLNAAGVPTLTSYGKWWPRTVQRLLRRASP